MKKIIYTVAVFTVTGIAVVHAQPVTENRAILQRGAPEVTATTVVRPMPAVIMKGEMVRALVATSGPVMMPAQMMVPMTGDEVTDARIRELVIEMDRKINAIRTEYEAKIKAVIGDSPIINSVGNVMQRGVPAMIQRDILIERTADGVNIQRDMPIRERGIGAPRPMNIEVLQNTEEGDQGIGFGAQVNRFFRGIFGGER